MQSLEIETVHSTESKQSITEKTFVSTLFSLPIFAIFFHLLQTIQQFYTASTSEGKHIKDNNNYDDGSTFATTIASSSIRTNQDLENALDDVMDDQKGISHDIDDLTKRIESLEERRRLRMSKNKIDMLDDGEENDVNVQLA